MWFKNILFYRFTEQVNYSVEQLQAAFTEHCFTPCKSQELSRYGWVPPHQNMGENLIFQSAGAFLITTQKEEKLVPSTVINQQLKDKNCDYREKRSTQSLSQRTAHNERRNCLRSIA